MSNTINIQTISNLNFSKINVNDPISNDQYMVFDISYGKSDPLFIYLETTDIIKYNEQEIIFDLNNNTELKEFFDKIDEVMINYIQTNKILKKYGLKNFNYKPINAIYTNKDSTKSDICKLRIDLGSQTKIFTNKDTQVKPSEWMRLSNSKLKGKCVAEFVEIVVDKFNNTIFLNVMIRQLKIKKVRTTRINNLPYSFVDSDEENLQSTTYSIQIKNNYRDQESVTMSAIAPTTQKDEINASDSQGYAEYSAINTFPHKKNKPVKISEKSSEYKEDTNNTEIVDDNTEYQTNKKETSESESVSENETNNTKSNDESNSEEESESHKSEHSSTKKRSDSDKSEESDKKDVEQNITTEVSEDF
jgi:hypothetical protein